MYPDCVDIVFCYFIISPIWVKREIQRLSLEITAWLA